jgi:hypothetical protein
MLSSSLAIVIAVVAVSAPTARAGETACAGVDRALTRSFSASVEPEIANQLGVDKVEVLQSFHYGQWRILYAEPSFRDGVFLFYSDDPKVQHFVTEWSGAATKFEEASIRNWAEKNAPGIPKRLARCFAWYVTKDRNRVAD